MPDNTEGVYLFVAPQFPPHAINELFLSPNSIPLDNDTVFTEMVLPYGHYEALGLWWYNKETNSNLADVFTLKISDNFLPFEFDLSSDEPVLETKLYANLNRVNRDASIEGTITFNGPFPENTMATAVAAFVREPERDVDYLVYLQSMDFSIDSNPYLYKLPVKSRNTIRYLAVFWLSDRSGLDNFKILGYYEDPANPGQAGILKPKADEKITGINIDADWSLIDN